MPSFTLFCVKARAHGFEVHFSGVPGMVCIERNGHRHLVELVGNGVRFQHRSPARSRSTSRTALA